MALGKDQGLMMMVSNPDVPLGLVWCHSYSTSCALSAAAGGWPTYQYSFIFCPLTNHVCLFRTSAVLPLISASSVVPLSDTLTDSLQLEKGCWKFLNNIYSSDSNDCVKKYWELLKKYSARIEDILSSEWFGKGSRTNPSQFICPNSAVQVA